MNTPLPRMNSTLAALADTALHLTARGFPAVASNPGGFCDAIDVSFACGLHALKLDVADPAGTASTGWSVCVHDDTDDDALADVSTADSSIDGLVALLLFGLSQALRPTARCPRSPR